MPENKPGENVDRKIWGYTASERQRRILEDLSDVAISLKIMEYNAPGLDSQEWFADKRRRVEDLRVAVKRSDFHYALRD